MTTLFIIDDHPLVADGVTTMLKSESNMSVIGVAKTGKEALSFLASSTPDIILLDINLPDIDGLELCERIKALKLNSQILILTSINDFAIISQALSKGANGYLLKDMERKELLEAIDTVLDRKIYVSNAANEKLLAQYQNKAKDKPQSIVLTRREKEILGLLDKGMNGPQIAEHLFISAYTVETHRKNLMQKLNATNTQMLLKMAREFHFLT
ncbi:response regulator transcription factor [Paucihalobacter sp.]|uniref:response regulator transcription factor n=1 Tax=Paucihalobacter sp. TaxID=2850405 RepID=UPI002FE18242